MNGRKEIGSDARQSPDNRAKQAEEEGSKKKTMVFGGRAGRRGGEGRSKMTCLDVDGFLLTKVDGW